MLVENDLLAAASFSPRYLVLPTGWIGHVPFAVWLTQQAKPRIVVELGTHTGNSYFAFCQAVAEARLDTRCYAVDTWQGDEHAGYYGDDIYQQVAAHNQTHYAQFSNLLRMTFDQAVDYFSDGSIDLLHIDGLHTYQAVKHDFETWLPKLSSRAVVLFHDINVQERNFGVWKLWEELRERYPNHLEFTHSHGLGVMQLDSVPDGDKISWLQQNSRERKKLQDYFSVLGEHHREFLCLNNTISALHQTVAERDTQIAERDARIGLLEQTVSGQGARIDALLASTSWRVTQPLRWIGNRIAKVRQCGNFFWELFRRDGLDVCLAKGMTVLRREGFAGVKLRLGSLLRGVAVPTGGNALFARNDYAEWVRRYDVVTDELRARLRTKIDGFAIKPLISVIMPTYNANVKWLAEAIDSIQKQLYPYWELCVADDASTDPAVRSLLEGRAAKDPRIKVVFRPLNGHISLASNSALELATGEWLALLDHDDLLSEHALFYVAEAVNDNPDAGLIYSDEDKLDGKGNRLAPYFKCDWNRDLFYSHNMITHLGVYRADLIREIGGFRQGTEGAQDYDLALRCIERVTASQIVHIPRVLYHWRMHHESTALSADAKPYAMLTGERVLNEHLARRKIAARAELIGHGFRVRYALPEKPLLVSLIIPTRNGLKLIRQCIESILAKTTYPRYEIIILDNASDDPETIAYFRQLEKEPRIRILHDENPFNYSALNNAGVRVASGKVVALLNNDLEVISPDWLTEMVSLALQPGVGAVGARLLYPDDTIQHGGVILGIGGWAGHAHKGVARGRLGYAARAGLIQEFSAVTAACMVIRRETYEKLGGFNETELQVACNDVEFCLRLRDAGLRNVWTPYAELYHHESATRGYDDTPEKKARFKRERGVVQDRWPGLFLHDPAYSPNLTLDHEDFSLAWPPRGLESACGREGI